MGKNSNIAYQKIRRLQAVYFFAIIAKTNQQTKGKNIAKAKNIDEVAINQEIEKLKLELKKIAKRKKIEPIYLEMVYLLMEENNKDIMALFKGVVSKLPKKSQKILSSYHDWAVIDEKINRIT